MNQGPRWDRLMKKPEVENLVTLSLQHNLNHNNISKAILNTGPVEPQTKDILLPLLLNFSFSDAN
jgi:hypothetical protein